MKKLFVGLIFLFFDFTLSLGGGSTLGLIPDTIGYLLLFWGFLELKNHSVHFRKPQALTLVMAGYSLIDYLRRLAGLEEVPVWAKTAGIVLGILALLAKLFITYEMVLGIKEAEFCTGISMRSGALLKAWRLWAAAKILVYLMSWIPVLGTAAQIVMIAANLFFLFIFVRLTKLKG